jgi:hypothetical protein
MNDENNIRLPQIVFNLNPLAIAQRRSEVVRGYTQIELVNTIDLSLRLFERREQTRPHI